MVGVKTRRVLIADDHRLVRAGFRRLLEDEADIEVVGEAGNGAEALSFVRTQSVDIVLLDISMPGDNGLNVLPQLKQLAPQVCVIIVSMHTDQRVVARALAGGASAYVSKESAGETLVQAIRDACGLS